MCAFSSNSRGAMRQCDPANVIRGLFGPKSQRNLSAASVLHIDEKTGEREGFFTWLKDIFNKPVEDKSHEADTSSVTINRTATTFDHPEITVSKRPADSSNKVDVVNQKLANLNTTQSMPKFENRNFPIEKYNAEKRANAIQRSATYISSQSSEPEKTLERGTDSDFTWLDLGEIHRSERNMIKFAARDDSEVTTHYHRYTNPRHCYRLPPQIKQPLLESCALNRNIGVSTRAIAGFAPRKPPVREPNMLGKREKTDEKKNRKEKKKPIIRTDGESADSSENRAEMIADDNPKGDPDTAFRYEWGVKLAEEQPVSETSDNDNFAEKSRRYVTKQFWGVNLKQPKPDVENAPSLVSEGPGRNAEEHRNTSPLSEYTDTIADETKSNVSSPLNVSTKESDASNLKGTIAEYLSTPSYQANLVSPSRDSVMPQQEKTDADSSLTSDALRKLMKTSNVEALTIDDGYNVPEGASFDTEIIAWKNLAMKSKIESHKEDYMSSDNVENIEMVSIRPEAPQPKLDVRVVRSTEDILEDQEVNQSNSEYKAVKSMKIKHYGSLHKPDGYVSSKRLHTASMQIRYAHTSSIATFSINSALIDETTQIKYSKFMSAFSTNSENSKEAIKTLNKQNKEDIDSKSWNKEGKTNDSNVNNSLSIKRSPLSSLESQTFSNSNKKSLDTDNPAETLNVIANKDIEISLNQSQTAGKKITRPSVSSESAQKEDEPRFKDEDVQDEIERYENFNANYMDSRNKDAIDFDTPSSDSGQIKSSNAKLSEEDSKGNKESDKNATLDSNVKDVKDEYIIDGDYVRLPGDPYPYNRENLDKWYSLKNFVCKSFKRETKFDSVSVSQPSFKNVNDNAYANVVRDSHADAVMKTSGSGDGAGAKNAGRSESGFHVSPRSQRVVSDCLHGDAADALGLQRWTEAFSQLDVGGEIDEAQDSDDASSRAYHQ